MEEKRSLTPAQIQYLRIGPKVCGSTTASRELQETLSKYSFPKTASTQMVQRRGYPSPTFLNLPTATSSTQSATSEFCCTVISWVHPLCYRRKSLVIWLFASIVKCSSRRTGPLIIVKRHSVGLSTTTVSPSREFSIFMEPSYF